MSLLHLPFFSLLPCWSSFPKLCWYWIYFTTLSESLLLFSFFTFSFLFPSFFFCSVPFFLSFCSDFKTLEMGQYHLSQSYVGIALISRRFLKVCCSFLSSLFLFCSPLLVRSKSCWVIYVNVPPYLYLWLNYTVWLAAWYPGSRLHRFPLFFAFLSWRDCLMR